MVMSAVALPLVTSVKVSGDTSLHLVKAMLMAFRVSSLFRVLGNFMILDDEEAAGQRACFALSIAWQAA